MRSRIMSEQEFAIGVSHKRPDVDSASTAAVLALLKRIQIKEMVFISASDESLPYTPGRKQIVFDHHLGVKGDKGGGSALKTIPGAEKILGKNFVQEIDEHDRTGRVQHPCFSLAEMFRVIKIEESSKGLVDRDLDLAIHERWLSFCTIIAKERKDFRRAYKEAPNVPRFKVGGHTFAMPGTHMPPGIRDALFKRFGVSCVLYRSRDSYYNVGVARYPDAQEPDLRALEDHLPGWFIHENGFLACWGSRKAPAKEPPPEGTPQNTKQLKALILEVFDKQ